jgi:hypothetical protein
MKIEKYTIKWLSWISVISFLLSISCLFIPSNCPIGKILPNIFIGILGSGLVVLFTSLISFSYKFRHNMEEMLFYSKRIMALYSNTRETSLDNMRIVSEKMEQFFQEFYIIYRDTEFNFFNIKFFDNTKDLFERLLVFLRPFLIINENIGKDDESIEWCNSSINDIKTITKVEYDDFVSAYENLYLIYDPKIFKYLQENNFIKPQG